MGEQAAKIGKKLEGFGVNFFANLGWTELTQDKEIKCTRSSHKKKTHGIDLLCKFTNPYICMYTRSWRICGCYKLQRREFACRY